MSSNPLKLEIEAVINDGQMEQSMSKIKNKLKDIESFTQGSSTPLSPQAEQMKNQQSKIIQDMQKRYTDDMLKRHEQIDKVVGNTDKLYQNQMLSKKAKVDLQEKMLKLLKEQKQIEDTLGMKATTTAGQPGVEAAKQEPGFAEGLKKYLKPAAIAGAINSALAIGMKSAEQEITAESKKIAFQTSAITKAARPMQEIYEGRGMEGQYFEKERMQALDIAAEQRTGQERLDTAGILAKAAGGAATGAVVGGGIPGAIVGGIVGLGAGLFGSDRGYAKVFDQDRYQSMLGAESMENFQKTEANLRAQNVPASMAMGAMQKFGGGLLQTQRATGMEDEELMSSFQDKMQFGGGKYSMQDVLSNQQAMLQAGASTQDLQGDLAGRAAAAEQYGLRGAGNIMGKLSAADKGETSTDDAFSRVLSKAVETGVNASDLAEMPQELNRFATMATDLATSGGAFSESIMGKFAAAITNLESKASLEGAASFVQQFEQKAGTVVGMEGQMGYGFLGGDKAEEIIGAEAKQKIEDEGLTFTLNKLTAKEMDENPDLVKGIAARIGVSVDKLRELIDSKEEAKQITTKPQREAIEQYKAAAEDYGARQEEVKKIKEEQGVEALTPEQQELESTDFDQTEEGAVLKSKFVQAQGEATGEEFRFDAKSRAASEYFLGDKKKGVGGEALSTILEQPKDTSLEKQKRAQAIGDIEMMDNLNKHLKDFGDAAERVSGKTAMFELAMSTFAETLKTGGKEAMDAFKSSIREMQTGKTPEQELFEALNGFETLPKLQNLQPK